MTVFAYVQAAPSEPQHRHERRAIVNHARHLNLTIQVWHGQQTLHRRRIEDTIAAARPGDHILLHSFSGTITTSEQLLQTLASVASGVSLHCCKTNVSLSKTDASALVLALASLYHPQRKLPASYKNNGRKRGTFAKSRLDIHEAEILQLSMTLSEYDVADRFDVDRHTLRRWKIRRAEIHSAAKQLGISGEPSITELKKILNNSL